MPNVQVLTREPTQLLMHSKIQEKCGLTIFSKL